jgi:hypothetical protein
MHAEEHVTKNDEGIGEDLVQIFIARQISSASKEFPTYSEMKILILSDSTSLTSLRECAIVSGSGDHSRDSQWHARWLIYEDRRDSVERDGFVSFTE